VFAVRALVKVLGGGRATGVSTRHVCRCTRATSKRVRRQALLRPKLKQPSAGAGNLRDARVSFDAMCSRHAPTNNMTLATPLGQIREHTHSPGRGE